MTLPRKTVAEVQSSAEVALQMLAKMPVREMYAPRKGVCAGIDMQVEIWMFRRVEGVVRFETRSHMGPSAQRYEYYGLPADLERQAGLMLDTLGESKHE